MTLTRRFVSERIKPRSPDSHKGDYGHVLVVAGSEAMTGAAYLTALGALRIGAGLVTVASEETTRSVVRNRLPEAMTIGFSDIFSYIAQRPITTLAIGPGLGIGKKQKTLILKLLALKLSTVLDADGLNNLSLKDLQGANAVLTPHEGELAHLTGGSRETIHREREVEVKKTAHTFGGICVLKGHRTLISDGRSVRTNSTGNPAMAAGGMGDVLTGTIAGLLAQGLSLFDAASAGVYLHGLAGDLAAKSDRGLLAHELGDALPSAIQKR